MKYEWATVAYYFFQQLRKLRACSLAAVIFDIGLKGLKKKLKG